VKPLADTPTYESIARRLSSRAALWLGAGWGFAEALLFFIVPDVWLGLVALYAPRRMLITLVAIVLGAVAGATVLFLVSLVLGDGFSGVIVALPGITDADLAQARAELAEQGPVAFLNGILQGLPVKVYIHAAALDGIELTQVVFFTLLNRVERLLVFGVVMALLGWLGRPVLRRWPRGCLALYGVTWIIFYAGFLLGRGG
jgi:membrane protein YqaA with SNARE-associated domain